MKDLLLVYQAMSGEKYKIAVFSQKGRSKLFEDEIERVVKEQELSADLFVVLLEGMYDEYCAFEDAVLLQRWVDVYVGELRFEDFI